MPQTSQLHNQYNSFPSFFSYKISLGITLLKKICRNKIKTMSISCFKKLHMLTMLKRSYLLEILSQQVWAPNFTYQYLFH